jgi:putative ABC transport system ATP-binding protein
MNNNNKINTNGVFIQLIKICKTYYMGLHRVEALKDVDLTIGHGEMVAIMGPSGSGKSTLMNILGCLDRPTSGRYLLAGSDVAKLSDNQLASIRNRTAGFVFQNFNLLPRTPAVENVALPMIYAGGRSNVKTKALEALEAVGLRDRWHHRPNELSGGEMQRVAIARAIVNDPDVIFADEPTGNLDSAVGNEILLIFEELNRRGKAVIIVTHDPDIGDRCPRIIKFRDGQLISDERR